MKHKIFIFIRKILFDDKIFIIFCACVVIQKYLHVVYIHKIWLRMKNMKIITNLSERV